MARRSASDLGPSAADILALYRLRETDQAERRLRILAHNFRLLTQMDHAIVIPEQYRATTKEWRTPFIRDAWIRTTASLTQKRWTSHIEPINETMVAKRSANIGERWFEAGCYEMDKAVGLDVVSEAVKNLVRDGESVINVVDRREAWANFPRRAGDEPDEYRARVESFVKGRPFPFAWRAVDRLQTVWGDGEFGDEWVIDYGIFPRAHLIHKYGMVKAVDSDRLMNPSGEVVTEWTEADREPTPASTLGGSPRPEGYASSSMGQATRIQFFNADTWAVLIDGNMAPGFPKRNPYSPFLPLIRARTDEDVEPVLYSLMFLGPRLDEVLTMWGNWAHLGAFPTPYLEDQPNSNALPGSLEPPLGDDGQSSKFTWSPGMMMELPRGKKLSFITAPPVGSDIRQMADLLRGLIDIAGIPSILRGSSLSGDSGYLANQMIAAATMMYRKLALATERQIERAGELIFHSVDRLFKSNTVFVMGQGRGAKAWLGLRDEGDTTDYIATVKMLGPLKVKMRPILPTMDQANALIARQLTEGDRPLDSRQHAMERWLDYEDPLAILDQIWVEQALEQPPLVEPVVQDALRRAGLLPPPPPPAPMPMPVDEYGQPMPPGIPAQLSGGQPTIPGLNAPLSPDQGIVGAPGGRPPGMYPGAPPMAPVGVG